ncbi:hypothetical protein AAFF_G00383450 [Aldrovandia affinis]|uniref:THAP9-like helix-turn-helix domain-containing protein n=1 Tax=Aldrovandia affinis TaxID=143900 RepID=A0AAD7X128_9TELE|nr:hypothetical protein AAFF_G00383450 [Aldrovandia affinis]
MDREQENTDVSDENTAKFINLDIPVELLKKEDRVFTPAQREFALTLHLHGPNAYSYLRDTMHIPLPHPHTLQRWK